MRNLLLISAAAMLMACSGADTPENQDDETEIAESVSGFLPLELTEDGRLIATLPPADENGVNLRAIHAMSLTAGLGSNPIGLDRGFGERGRVIRFRTNGSRVTVEAENSAFRASAENEDERRAVEESFGRSILFSKTAEEVTDNGVRVDVTDLFLSDLLGIGEVLDGFSLDKERSMLSQGSVLGFDDNTEIDVELTFSGNEPQTEIQRTAPYAKAVTLTLHHTLARLPGEGYEMKPADARFGTFEAVVYDYSAPLNEEVPRAFALRHRIEEGEPIVFYVDRGAPEPVKSALIEGAGWWAEGFEAAGLPDMYRVEELPEGIHPSDIRYNVIRWVHRQTRGWSYGGAVADPRTGEMLKGNVILGSQRVRQDRMIFEGLAGTGATGSGNADDPTEMSLARIRQLAAHEVGHALGFGHNFAASTADRSSVMDYPAPFVIARNGELDFSQVYDTGLGEWDKLTVRWLYGGEDAVTLIEEAREKGLPFIQDGHGRGAGTAHPQAAVWDNGNDPVAELANVIEVRRIALENFGEDRVAEGQAADRLRQVLVPIYLYHRYQTAAAAKSIGGASFAYGQAGGDPTPVEVVPAEQQREALDAVMRTLTPSFLAVSEDLLAQLPPGAGAMPFASAREQFGSETGAVFDLMSAAEASADITLGAILAPARLERLAQFHARRSDNPSVAEVLDTLIRRTLNAESTNGQEEALARLVEARLVAALITADGDGLSTAVRAELQSALRSLAAFLDRRPDAQSAFLAAEIESHLQAPAMSRSRVPEEPVIPPGSPIGSTH
ncbi:zinc-dependent metalloprotease [Parvularcula maris]|uniref:Zinc-dependent metalloprotease n=1 Tax=Parvularcula maris TaxID=2965077 RepID=A0A9X2L843_9PROT|nr:zinc-dependent metalloprotease [Parvularcula maris]MCQ8183892.1 zinc-dependent metalloprotease [Parvularcula maris]